MPETHVAISYEQAHALVTKWHSEWAAQDADPKGYRPPRIDWNLAEAIGIPGVVYKWDENLIGIKVRKRGKLWFWTGLPLWEADERVLESLRIMMRAILAGRTISTGFNVGIK